MTDSKQLENLAAYNEESLEELKRTLQLSKGSFSLIYGRCNEVNRFCKCRRYGNFVGCAGFQRLNETQLPVVERLSEE